VMIPRLARCAPAVIPRSTLPSACHTLLSLNQSFPTGSSNTTPFSRGIKTGAVSYGEGSHASVKKTLDALLDKGESALFDVKISDIIEAKPDKRVASITADETVFNAIKVMSEQKVGALVVVDKQNTPVGIITERDYLNKLAIKGLSSRTTHVKDVMTKNISTTQPSTAAAKCMDMMTQGRFRHIPVVDDSGSLVGIISIGDLVKHVLDQQKFTIRELREYIQRSY